MVMTTNDWTRIEITMNASVRRSGRGILIAVSTRVVGRRQLVVQWALEDLRTLVATHSQYPAIDWGERESRGQEAITMRLLRSSALET